MATTAPTKAAVSSIDLLQNNPVHPFLVQRMRKLEDRVSTLKSRVKDVSFSYSSVSGWTFYDERNLRLAVSAYENALKELSDMRVMIWQTALQTQKAADVALFE